VAVRRGARPGRADDGDRQASRADDPRRAGGEPGSAGQAEFLGGLAFGFALGVAAGLLIRRTIPAMAVTLQAALAPLHLRDVISYQPASRFWAFQWYEAVIFLALAVALAGWSA
jgi:hypothetical protein